MTPSKQLPRDIFLYLLAIIALGMVAVNLGTLLYQLVNVYVPDVLTDRYMSVQAYYGSIRWAIATLIVVFPVFLWVIRFLQRDMAQQPEKRELKVRKWLLYLTLFLAAVVIIGDSVAVVYNFLQGELTLKFIMKAGVIFAIAGSIFFYYLNELRQQSKPLRVFVFGVIAFVIAAVVAGFLTAGLPPNQRLVRLDDQRVQDLQTIQSQVIQYWQSKARLPATLSDLRNDISGFVPPTDPITQQPYEYSVLGNLKFQLCATFAASNAENNGSSVRPVVAPYPMYDGSQSWPHGVGRTCFERTIDPDLFKPLKQ